MEVGGTQDAQRDARVRFLEAYRAQMSGEFAQAIDLYRDSLQLFPTAEAHTFLGWTLSLLSRHEEAIDCCRRAIEIDPAAGNAYNDIGAYRIETGKPREAVPWLEQALAAPRYESRHVACYNLGRAHEMLHDPDQAQRWYRESLRWHPDFRPALEASRALEARRN
ncbi:MAG: tetratricopeptide repeat protein [Candidatus Eisenbacteria bacterium]|nr:tetratricopeptide repeat protein [Candidatus Eisenbacteria bacterium]